MKKQEHEFMTAREFAAAIKRPYPTVALWLRKGLVDGVKEIELGTAKLWQIPASAVQTFVPPKRGRPKKESAKSGAKKSGSGK
jgi:hypothetical protein